MRLRDAVYDAQHLMADLFSVRTEGEITVVYCRGAIVFGGEAADLSTAVHSLMAPGRRIVLDLAGVTRLDSFGIGVLFGIYTAALTAGAKLVLCGLSDVVRQLLEQASLISMLDVYSSDTEAVQALSEKHAVDQRR